MISITEAIKYPFSKADWKQKVGVIFLVFFILSTITFIVQFFVQMPAEFAAEMDTNNEGVAAVASLFSGMISMIVSLVSLPVYAYLNGYNMTNTKNIMNGDNELPVHTDIWNKMLMGLVKVLIGFIYGLPAFILYLGSIVAIIAAVISYRTNESMFMTYLIVFGILILIVLLYAVFVLPFLDKSATYIYLKTGKIKSILDFKTVFNTVKQNFKAFGYLFLVDILYGIAGIVIILFTLCISFFTAPMYQTSIFFAKAYIDGNVYKSIKDKELV